MSTYELKPIIINGRTLFTAEVDCDDRDAPLYRATSTCHVAFMLVANAHFFYSNFILSNEATSTSGSMSGRSWTSGKAWPVPVAGMDEH